MTDFTLNMYRKLLKSFERIGYNFKTFDNYIQHHKLLRSNAIEPICILRHDVDREPLNSLFTAKLENELEIKGSYYFRIVSESFDERIIREIIELGHEVGYHYEDVDLVLKSQKSKVKIQNGKIDEEKLIDLAYESFCKNLDTFRKNFDIKTICMHGSPLSKYDNKMIWKKYDYKKLGLLGEPYFDIDWTEFGYLTDTGRKWNGEKSSVRDKVDSKFKFDFSSTLDIINNMDKFPDKLMLTVHPQRWNAKIFPWVYEYISQNLKNIIKKYIYVQDKI